MHPLHTRRASGRRSPRGTLAGIRQDRMRSASHSTGRRRLRRTIAGALAGQLGFQSPPLGGPFKPPNFSPIQNEPALTIHVHTFVESYFLLPALSDEIFPYNVSRLASERGTEAGSWERPPAQGNKPGHEAAPPLPSCKVVAAIF